MRVPCKIEEVELDGDCGPIDGVRATCSRCGHVTESYGTSSRSVRRCLWLMGRECTETFFRNYYVARSDIDRSRNPTRKLWV